MSTDKQKKELPPEVQAALDNLRAVAKRHSVSMVDVIPVSPNQALMWEMSDKVHMMRRLLDRWRPGWDDPM